MITRAQRDPWRAVWQVATSDHLLVVLLLTLAAGAIAATWLPQMPAADPVAHAQWLSEAQARFKEATATLQALGLFTITRSIGFRALLALLAGCILIRLVEGSDRLRLHRQMAQPTGDWRSLTHTRPPEVISDLRRRRYRVLSNPAGSPPLFQADRWPWADLFPLLAHAGALLLLIGVLVTHVTGWREAVTIRGGERVTLAGTGKWVALEEDARGVTHSPGIVTLVEQHITGVEVAAFDGQGNPLALQAPEAAPVARLTVPLTEDSFFAVPEAQLVVRLAVQPDHPPGARSPVLVQVYRSPPGRLITETVTENDTELFVDEATLTVTGVPYAQLAVTFNPGLWPSSVGIVLLAAGLLGSIARPTRRFWVRERDGKVEIAGDVPAALAAGEER